MQFSSEYYNNLESRIPTGKLRTRFAPSPTGYMHLGNLRTALYTYLLAKKEDGVFILRVEDTDQERFIEGALDLIYDTLKSAGIIYDEGPDVGGPVGPYIQSERREIYSAYIELLLKKGHAYLCFCNKEELDEQRNIHKASRVPHKYDGRCALLSTEEVARKKAEGIPYVIRQKIPNTGTTSFEDLTFGRIEVENSTLDDTVLVKSDGMPTYNFANVVDDHLMGITHIIRGSEYLASTPKYILLYKSFGWDIPAFIHCSPIMKDATNKLSKRDGDAYFNDFIEKGYLVEAIINYIALLGWSPGGEEIKYTIAELESAFDVKGISKDPSIFDYKNLNAINGSYIRALSDEAFYGLALPYINKSVEREIDTVYTAKILKERCELLSEIPEQLDFIDNLPNYSLELYKNKKMNTTPENAKEALVQILSALEGISKWTPEIVREEMLQLANTLGLKNGRILWPLRVAVSGKMFTPGGGIEISVILGKSETVSRIKKAITMLEENKVDRPIELQTPVNDTATVQKVEHKEAIEPPEIVEQKTAPVQESVVVDESGSAAFRRQSRRKCSGDSLPAERRGLGQSPILIQRIASISKLNVDGSIKELGDIIKPTMDMLDVLKNIELPMTDYPLDMTIVNVFREDVNNNVTTREEALIEREKLLAVAPNVEAGCVSVPKILGSEE